MTQSAESLKSQFPIFSHWPAWVYLDSAATSQKPLNVIEAMTHFYEFENAAVHRGLYKLSSQATQRYEEVRTKTAQQIGARSAKSIAFTQGTTESINCVAQGFLKKNLHKGDSVVISAMEHHANLIPWQQLCKQTGAHLKIIPVSQQGDLVLDHLDEILDKHTRLVALTHISNVLGTINPVEEIIFKAHQRNIPVLLDCAQSAGHYPFSAAQLDVDFLAFSAHKMFGPLGTGILYVKEEFASVMDPHNFGGGAIKNVTVEETEFLEYPHNLEAGTPNISGVIGFGAALDFLHSLDLEKSHSETNRLTRNFRERLRSLNHIEVIGDPKQSAGIISFTVKDIHPHDVAGFLSHNNIAVRAGHHCAQPLLESLGIPATVRASFSIYNTAEDADKTIDALVELKKFWS